MQGLKTGMKGRKITGKKVKPCSKSDECRESRFGFSVASVGDLDLDGYPGWCRNKNELTLFSKCQPLTKTSAPPTQTSWWELHSKARAWCTCLQARLKAFWRSMCNASKVRKWMRAFLVPPLATRSPKASLMPTITSTLTSAWAAT